MENVRSPFANVKISYIFIIAGLELKILVFKSLYKQRSFRFAKYAEYAGYAEYADYAE